MRVRVCICTDLQSSSETELATKTAEWQQAMDIGQDLLEKTRDLQDQLDDAHDLTEQLKVQLDPMETELAQLKDMIVDHEENAALIEEERQGMEEQRYRISELEGLRDLLEQELRDKEEAFEVRLQDELEQQKDSLEQKFQSELAWEQQKTERALEEAAAVAQDSQQQEASDVEKLKTQIAELQTLVDTTNRSLAMEQSFASAHKNEIKKGQVALAEAKREKKDTVEKIKAKDSQFKKLQGTKDDSDKLAQAKTQEVAAPMRTVLLLLASNPSLYTLSYLDTVLALAALEACGLGLLHIHVMEEDPGQRNAFCPYACRFSH
jgi:chromosome segregation ATPase